MATVRTPWTARLASLRDPIPAVFDEQARYLGPRVERISLDGEGVVRRGGNAFLLGPQAVCLGFDKDRAVFNAELLEKCAKAYVLATLSGLPVRRLPFYVRHIAWRRLRADERRAASQCP